MMQGHEKSDSVIVAVKPANKVVRPAAEQSVVGPAAAEPAEPRAETKGNAGQQSTCRAQSRISVSQALERIRKVARERKKKLTALAISAQSISPVAIISLRDLSATRVSCTPFGRSSSTFSIRPASLAPAWYQWTSCRATPCSSLSQ